MLKAAEAARRRELQGRAYAPGGSLTDAEIAELRDLDERNMAAPPSVAPSASAADPASVAGPEPVAGLESAAGSEPAVGPEQAAQPVRGVRHVASDPEEAAIPAPRAAHRPRRRWLLPVIAVAVILVGFAFGRFVLGSGADSVPMNDAQQEVWAELEGSGKYTPGSVLLSGSEYGADVWLAHRVETDVRCMILTRGEDRGEGCGVLDPGPHSDALTATLNYTDDGTEYLLYATSTSDIDGNPVTYVQRQSAEWDWRSIYTDAELTMVEALEAHGFDGELLDIVGYDDGVPVWVSNGARPCLMIVLGDEVQQQCGEAGTGADQLLPLEVDAKMYTVTSSDSRGLVLTITRIQDLTMEG